MTAPSATPRRDAERRLLLAAALPHVPFDGWTFTAMRAGADDRGLPPADVRRLFPCGPDEMVAFFAAEADRTMETELARRDLGAMRVRDRIATAVRVRLEQYAGRKDAVRRALALRIPPGDGPGGLRALYRTVDAMWRAAGDASTDHNFYTKRLLLAGVYMATLLFWLGDASEDGEATWAFLDRRVGDVMRLQKAKARVGRRLPDPDAVVRRLARRRAAPAFSRPSSGTAS